MVLLHGTEVWWVFCESVMPVKLVESQVFRLQYGWLLEVRVTGANQVDEHRILEDRQRDKQVEL